ncbi:16S rRNA (cytosine(967)-C(5))-methyltransferase [Globicatella sp. HMSC072A10]|uniref:16S rRNA (cytosine(967)-C(5))-methyltransferase RsmB n=1 Tax=Globicatella sp. HMSC072A10 TaxID=1739315 RepID=UPI0008BF01FD|nr:16S rRNA (cytosine(967)-C(5))-methyltransferase RsmB [Globicatella sp. HMSC072A10]OFK56082.1 16S rRNA (cytosine(967)-C(5))-methyltransferase [Globicatella sp. HMSC072A10]
MKIKQRSEKQLANNVRWQALKLIHQIEYENQYSNVLIDQTLQHTHLNELDQKLLVQLVYGVVQRRLTLDYYLEPFIKGKKVDTWIASLFRLSVYQLLFLDKIPDHAVLNEAVEIAKTNGHGGLGKFVNAILRQFKRQPLRVLPDKTTALYDYLSIQYSMPLWLVEQLSHWLGDQSEQLELLLKSLLKTPHLSARVIANTDQRQEIQQQLQTEQVITEPSKVSPYGLIVQSGDLIHSNVFKEGRVTIQDESSMLVAPLGKIIGTEQILDACSAPGGKATHIAQLLTTGHLTALDLSSYKLKKVDQHLQRMGLVKKVTTQQADASKFLPKNNVLYDTIYLDAPCSGLGLMRRKPEIKYEKQAQDLVELAKIQAEILNHVASLLKPGGVLVYSTCTLAPIENEQMVDQFLANHTDFQLDPIQPEELLQADLLNSAGQIRVWPHQYHTDGFFISRFVKK